MRTRIFNLHQAYYFTIQEKGGATVKHQVKMTVIDKKLFPELQERYCADKQAGTCPCYNVGDEFLFERDGDKDHF